MLKTVNVRKQRCGGFTLVELLMVIVIVAILGTIVISITGRARSLADQTVDIASLRTLHQAVTAYANDNDGYYPKGAGGSPNMLREMGNSGYLAHPYDEYIDVEANALEYLPTYLWSTYYRDERKEVRWWRSSFAFNRYIFGNYSDEKKSGASYYGRVNIRDALPGNWMFTETDLPGRSNFAESGGKITQGWNRDRNNENLVVTVSGSVSKVKLDDNLTIKREWMYPENSNVIKNP